MMSAVRITPVIDQLLLGVTVMRFPFGFAQFHRTRVAVVPDRLARAVRPGRAGVVALLKGLGVCRFLLICTPIRQWSASVDGRIFTFTSRSVISGPAFKRKKEIGVPAEQIALSDILVMPMPIKALQVKYLLEFITLRMSLNKFQSLIIVFAPQFSPLGISTLWRTRLIKFLHQGFIGANCSIHLKSKLWIEKIIVEVSRPSTFRSSRFQLNFIGVDVREYWGGEAYHCRKDASCGW